MEKLLKVLLVVSLVFLFIIVMGYIIGAFYHVEINSTYEKIYRVIFIVGVGEILIHLGLLTVNELNN